MQHARPTLLLLAIAAVLASAARAKDPAAPGAAGPTVAADWSRTSQTIRMFLAPRVQPPNPSPGPNGGSPAPAPSPAPGPQGAAAPAAPPVMGAAAPPPSGGFNITSIEDTDQAVTNAPDPTAQRAAITARVPAMVQALREPPPPGADAAAYNKARNELGSFLNRFGSDQDKSAYQGSMDLAHDVLSTEPDNRDALNNMAGAHYGMGQYKEAVQAATRAVDIYKDDGRVYTTRALAHFQMKEYAQAYEDAQLALKLDANNTVAYQVSQLSKTRVTTAADLGLDAAQSHAAEQVKREYEGMLAERGRAEAAASTQARAPARAPAASPAREVDALLRQAASKMKMGDYAGAREEAELALARDPSNPDAYQTRAAALSLAGDYEKAAADATAALERRPDSVDSLLTRSRAEQRLGRWQEALADADRAVAHAPRDAGALKARAQAKEGLGDLAGMLDDLRRAARVGGPQFDAELRETASKYGVALDASGPAAPAAPTSAPGKRNLALILAFTLAGGLLVAYGLVRVFTGGRPAVFSRVAGASPETAKALAAAGGLGAGYEMVRTLGHGGMGVVFEAIDKALERRVAVKKMRDEIRLDDRERARFLQEARIVAQLHHPNIVEIHTIVSEGDDLYLVFEYVEGHTVDQILERKGRLTVPEAQWVLHGVARALEYAHQRGVVHRDLKPSNIMVEKGGAVKVMDFGIARQAKDALARSTMTGTVAGTPQYMAPEQEEGVVRPESDVFSMGAMLYEMVTGQRPYPTPSTTASKLNKRYEKPSRLQADLPPELEKLIDDCLEPDPEKRPRSADQFRARLDALKASAPAKSA